MLNLLKKLGLPVSMFVLAIAGAFATTSSSEFQTPQPVKWANDQCEPVEAECSLIFNPIRCTDSSDEVLHHYDGTSCEQPLYMKII